MTVCIVLIEIEVKTINLYLRVSLYSSVSHVFVFTTEAQDTTEENAERGNNKKDRLRIADPI